MGVCTGLSFETDGLCGRVIVLVVDEHRRGQGIGLALMQQAERWLVEQGARTAIINSGKQRLDAHRFYEYLGYKATGLRLLKPLSKGAE